MAILNVSSPPMGRLGTTFFHRMSFPQGGNSPDPLPIKFYTFRPFLKERVDLSDLDSAPQLPFLQWITAACLPTAFRLVTTATSPLFKILRVLKSSFLSFHGQARLTFLTTAKAEISRQLFSLRFSPPSPPSIPPA